MNKIEKIATLIQDRTRSDINCQALVFGGRLGRSIKETELEYEARLKGQEEILAIIHKQPIIYNLASFYINSLISNSASLENELHNYFGDKDEGLTTTNK